MTQANSYFEIVEDVTICSADLIDQAFTNTPIIQQNPIDTLNWINADYSPLPTLVAAARSIFQHDALPYIKSAQSAGIPNTIANLVVIGRKAHSTNTHHLALVTGVPGAGKTLVGLQFVYDNHFGDKDAQRTAVFLSGNGPLVKVLQHALKSSVFVQDVHGFLKQYGGQSKFIPDEHIFVFDEAQRAWDAERVLEKRGHSSSEPEDFLQIGEKKRWSMMIGLIGDGQEIHLGEESGLSQWNIAISKMKNKWTVHCPSHVSSIFPAADSVETDETLNLTASLRSYLASDVQEWIKSILAGELEFAAKLIKNMYKQDFNVYATQNHKAAYAYVRLRYSGQVEKRYGLLASSKAKNLSAYDIHNEFQWTQNLREGPWYNDAPSSPKSCCQLRDVATEFSCQGLELDFPIVVWGDDLRWETDRWVSPAVSSRNKARDPHQLRINSYRVLLSRGRDGMIIFVPPIPQMMNTYMALRKAGIKELNVDKLTSSFANESNTID